MSVKNGMFFPFCLMFWCTHLSETFTKRHWQESKRQKRAHPSMCITRILRSNYHPAVRGKTFSVPLWILVLLREFGLWDILMSRADVGRQLPNLRLLRETPMPPRLLLALAKLNSRHSFPQVTTRTFIASDPRRKATTKKGTNGRCMQCHLKTCVCKLGARSDSYI